MIVTFSLTFSSSTFKRVWLESRSDVISPSSSWTKKISKSIEWSLELQPNQGASSSKHFPALDQTVSWMFRSVFYTSSIWQDIIHSAPPVVRNVVSTGSGLKSQAQPESSALDNISLFKWSEEIQNKASPNETARSKSLLWFTDAVPCLLSTGSCLEIQTGGVCSTFIRRCQVTVRELRL